MVFKITLKAHKYRWQPTQYSLNKLLSLCVFTNFQRVYLDMRAQFSSYDSGKLSYLSDAAK